MKPEDATRRIEAFGKRFGKAHLYLAYHAAFPLALTPDLLYRLWANFQRDINGEVLSIPWMAVADLLLSSLCDEVGDELYEMDTAIRNALLKELKENPCFDDKRIDELSDFLLTYVQQQLESHDPDIRDFAQAQRWTALAYTRPSEAARELALALSTLKLEDKAEWIRMASIVETFAEPLAEFQPLLIYARRMANFTRGKQASGKDQLTSLLADQESLLHIAGVNLPIPEQIATSVDEDSPITQFSTDYHISSESSRTERILAVDDSVDNLTLLQIILEVEGYEVDLVSDGLSALKQVAQNPPDLILLDPIMPGMDGIEVTRYIRNNPDIHYIPILLLTAYAEVSVVEGLDAGADDFIRKPFDQDEFLARVRSLLRKHSINQREKTVRGSERDIQGQSESLQVRSQSGLRASAVGIAKVREVLERQAWTKRRLAKESSLSEKTVQRFFKGEVVNPKSFLNLCDSLKLNWEEIAQLQSTSDETTSSPNEYIQSDKRSFQNPKQAQSQLVNEQLRLLIREVLQYPNGSIERQKAMIELKGAIDRFPGFIENLESWLHE